jgi:hypothetical protein
MSEDRPVISYNIKRALLTIKYSDGLAEVLNLGFGPKADFCEWIRVKLIPTKDILICQLPLVWRVIRFMYNELRGYIHLYQVVDTIRSFILGPESKLYFETFIFHTKWDGYKDIVTKVFVRELPKEMVYSMLKRLFSFTIRIHENGNEFNCFQDVLNSTFDIPRGKSTVDYVYQHIQELRRQSFLDDVMYRRAINSVVNKPVISKVKVTELGAPMTHQPPITIAEEVTRLFNQEIALLSYRKSLVRHQPRCILMIEHELLRYNFKLVKKIRGIYKRLIRRAENDHVKELIAHAFKNEVLPASTRIQHKFIKQWIYTLSLIDENPIGESGVQSIVNMLKCVVLLDLDDHEGYYKWAVDCLELIRQITSRNTSSECKDIVIQLFVEIVYKRRLQMSDAFDKNPFEVLVGFLHTSGWYKFQNPNIVELASTCYTDEVKERLLNYKCMYEQKEQFARCIGDKLAGELAFGLYSVLLGYSGLC